MPETRIEFRFVMFDVLYEDDTRNQTTKCRARSLAASTATARARLPDRAGPRHRGKIRPAAAGDQEQFGAGERRGRDCGLLERAGQRACIGRRRASSLIRLFRLKAFAASNLPPVRSAQAAQPAAAGFVPFRTCLPFTDFTEHLFHISVSHRSTCPRCRRRAWYLVANNARCEVHRHCGWFAFLLIANRTRHAHTTAAAGARGDYCPGSVGMVLADPAGIFAVLARRHRCGRTIRRSGSGLL